MSETVRKPKAARENSPGPLYRRIERKLGIERLHSDHDLARVVEDRLPLASVESLTSSGLTDQEIYAYVLPRRTLMHRRARREPLTHEESDRAVRIARASALAEEVFGNEEKAARWLRKPKQRFAGRTPLEVLRTGAGARIVDEMLLQLEYGFVA